MRALFMGVVLGVAGCEAGPTESTVRVLSEVCVDGDELLVTFNTCLSSSCDTLVSATCTTTFDGSVLDVSGEATISSQGDQCTADCGFVTARCPIPEDADRDTVIVTFGGDSGGPVLADATCGT